MEASGAACFNTLLYINAQGQILGKHRSLVLSGAQIDQRQVSGPLSILDVAGHDVRPDIYHLTISREPHTIIHPEEIAHERV